MEGILFITHMLSGKAVARSIRGHFLAQSALHHLLFKQLTAQSEPNLDMLSDNDINYLQQLYSSIIKKEFQNLDEYDHSCLRKFDSFFKKSKTSAAAKSDTAQLWVKCVEFIDILKAFIRAERTGDWNLHLYGLSQMLKVFAATSHNIYAKCSRLYLQLMLNFPNSHPRIHDLFVNHGMHTVR